MSKNTVEQPSADDEIDLRELFGAIWKGKWVIIATTFIFAVGAVFYALSLPNIYKSEVLLAPVAEQRSTGLSGQLGGLAALAGVNIGGGTGVDQTLLAIEILQSRDFLIKFINKQDILVQLMAVKGWDFSTEKYIYDSNLYDISSGDWLRDVSPPKKAIPSNQEAYTELKRLLKISQDVDSRMLKLSIEHYSPVFARDVVNNLVVAINFEMRRRDIEEARRSIRFIQMEINETLLDDVKISLFSLIEEQTKKLMLANAREEYAFRIIDTAYIPEEKSGPKRLIIVLMVLIFGGLTSTMAVVILSYKKE